MKAHLYLFDGWADWEPAFVMAGINNPQFQRQPGLWTVGTVAVKGGVAVRSMGGITCLPDQSLDELEPEDSDLLILPGGPAWDLGDDPNGHDAHRAAVEKAVEWLDRGILVAAICGATAGLARAGALDGRDHTSNAATYLKGTGYEGASRYKEQSAVHADGLVTAGGMASLEFAREIFAQIGLYDEPVLHAWYELYRTGKSEYFARMRSAAQPAASAQPA